MPGLAAEGPLSGPTYKLALVVSESPTLRVACGLAADDAAAADKLIDGVGHAKRIWYPTAPTLETLAKPAAIVSRPADAQHWERVAGGSQNYLWPRGNLRVTFTDEGRHGRDLELSQRYFDNLVGKIVDEIKDLAGRDDRLTIHTITEEQGPVLPEEWDEAGQDALYFWASYLFEWGR